MGFKSFDTSFRTQVKKAAGIRVSLTKRGAPKACLKITITPEAFAQLGFQADAPIELLLGEGADEGKLLLDQGPDVGAESPFTLSTRKGPHNTIYYVVNAGACDFIPDVRMEGQWCEFSGKDGIAVLTLPDFTAIIQRMARSAPKTIAEAPTRGRVSIRTDLRPRQSQLPGTAPRDPNTTLTGTLCGDPQPGRSALDRMKVGAA